MRVSTNYTIRSGPEANFDSVSENLRQSFPNSTHLLRNVEQPKELAASSRWRHHVLRQLTFSYLTQEYVARTVRGVLDDFPSDQDAPAFRELRSAVQAVATGSVRLTKSSVAHLNDVAIRLANWCDANRLTIIEVAMNALGRWLFSDATPANRRRVEKHLAFLMFGLESHIGVDVFGRRMRECLSFSGYSDPASLKAACISALTAARDDLLQVVEARCVFIAPDIKMHADTMRIGDVAILKWGTPALEDFLSTRVQEVLAPGAENAPYTAYLTLSTSCHPEGLGEALTDAASQIQIVTGFLVSQTSGVYNAPRQYGGIVFQPNSAAFLHRHPSGKPRNSLLLVTREKAQYFEHLYTDYIAPALDMPVEPSLQERLRRALRSLRKASYSAGSHEWSQAYASAWQGYEVVFGGTESRERGATISRRVAALAVGPDGLRTDDSFTVTDEDLVNFSQDWKQGKVNGLNIDQDVEEMLSSIADNGANAEVLLILRTSLDSDANDVLLRWKEDQITGGLPEVTSDNAQLESNRRREELRVRLEECYKLRNDIVHAGYDYEPIAEEMYKEISGLFQSFIVNLAYNCTRKVTYTELLTAMDDEWRRPVLTDHKIRERAYFNWLERGQPIGDDWADWFCAEQEEASNNSNDD